MTVQDAAFMIVHELRISTTTFESAERFCRMLASADLVPGENRPYEERRVPPSLAICRRVLDVPGLDRYVIDVCKNGCRWYLASMSNPAEHLKHCTNCDHCRCPLCHEPRFVEVSSGRYEPASICYFLPDSLEYCFLNLVWVAALLEGS
jgi:hypothetical protein